MDILKKSVKMKVKTFTFASSCSVYGDGSSNPRSEKDEVKPLTAYAKSKLILKMHQEILGWERQH